MSKIQTAKRFSFKVPYCRVCLKAVDKYSMERDQDRGEIRLIAECHGEADTSPWIREDMLAQLELEFFFADAKHRMLGNKDVTHKIAKDAPVDERFKVNAIRNQLRRH